MINFLKRKKTEVLTAIEKLKDERILLVTFDELSKTPFNKCEDIYPERPNSVTCTRVKNKHPQRVSFRVTMKAGEEWHNHYHDCEETLIVSEGSIYDSLNKKEVSHMETMKINPYQRHIIKALEDCVFYVGFVKKPNKWK